MTKRAKYNTNPERALQGWNTRLKIQIKQLQAKPNPLEWKRESEGLPIRFESVLVLGVVEKINVLRQIYEGRRWTGWTQGWEGQREGKEPPWEWLTPCDARITYVTYWMPIPTLPDEEEAKDG